MPVSIVISSKNTTVMPSEYLAVYERRSTGSDYLDLSNREHPSANLTNLNMKK